jgi:hypothetical protein
VLAAAVVSYRRGCGAEFPALIFEEELSPAPKGYDTDCTVSVIWGAILFSARRLPPLHSASSCCAASWLVGGGRCSVKNNGFVKFMKNDIHVSSH